MKEIVFESKLLPDGHLYCPKEFVKKKNVRFKVIVYFEESEELVTEKDIELASSQDLSEDFLSEKELNYYLRDLEKISVPASKLKSHAKAQSRKDSRYIISFSIPKLRRAMGNFKRGQIWLVNFDPSFGHEYKKIRPALIIGNKVIRLKTLWVSLGY